MEETGTMKCRQCGAEGEGKFCGQCGSGLGEVARPSFCNLCGTAVKGEERFCTECGASLEAAVLPAVAATAPPAAPTPSAQASAAPTAPRPLLKDGSFVMVATACMLALGAGVVVGKLGSGGEEIDQLTGMTAPLEAAANPANVDLASMTPREAADRLYNRVMTAAQSGDTAGAEQFLPMAIGAHDRAEPLDLDGIFHKTILERLANDTEAALASSERILTEHPTNLLGLASAAEAAAEGGDDATANAYYRRFLDAYDSEIDTQRPEYEQHGNMLPGMRAAALLATGS